MQGESRITQNIDGLHQEANSSNVIELHGTQKVITVWLQEEIFWELEQKGVPNARNAAESSNQTCFI